MVKYPICYIDFPMMGYPHMVLISHVSKYPHMFSRISHFWVDMNLNAAEKKSAPRLYHPRPITGDPRLGPTGVLAAHRFLADTGYNKNIRKHIMT